MAGPYGWLTGALHGVRREQFETQLKAQVIPRLARSWVDRYSPGGAPPQVVEVSLDTFTYLFDIAAERNIAAFGFMRGKNSAARDASRMSGYPKAEGRDYHRGHMIPHTGHGGTDINLFIQQGKVNVGPFRRLEIRAVDTPGAFYFVNLLYPATGDRQRPTKVEQGLILPGSPPTFEFADFGN